MMQSPLFAPVRFLVKILAWILAALFGRLNWQPPIWLVWIGRIIQKIGSRPGGYAGMVVALAALIATSYFGWQYWRNLPKPHTVEYHISAPALTNHEKTPPIIAPLRIVFNESVAPLALIGKEVAKGVGLTPTHPGKWKWQDDKTLEFNPQEDWPAGESIRIDFAEKNLFAAGVKLGNYQPSFATLPLAVNITGSELYQDPLDGSQKKVIATIESSHPLDEPSLHERIKLQLGEGLSFQNSTSERSWELTIDKNRLKAYLKSSLVKTPLETSQATITIDKGVKTPLGGNPTSTATVQNVSVPGRYKLSFDGITLTYVNSAQGQPEQVLMFDSSFPVPDAAIRSHVHAWVLPKDRDWQLTDDSLKQIKETTLTHIPSSEPQNSHHSFKLTVPTDRRLYVKIDERIESDGGYLSKQPATATVSTGKYPKIIKILGDGALLSLKGEKKIGFMAQGVPGVRIEIAQLLPNQLNHLVDQNYNRFEKPSISGEDLDRLVERKEWTRTFAKADPAKLIYDSFDLTDYLNSQGGRRGIFVVRLSPYDPAQKELIYDETSREGDRRFILMTDLGIINKRNLDGSQDVYVQSITTGKPVGGAKVEMLGRNGLPVLDAQTDQDGHARLSKLVRDLNKDKTPIMITASLDRDLSFLPLLKDEHRLNMSRFDTGGDVNASEAGELNAYMFSDRRLYRPGETVHLGYILRAADWAKQIAGIPVEIEIIDPRGRTSLKERRTLPADGLDSIDYSSSESAAVGEYTASVYLIKNSKRANSLGFVNFKIQDFEPDRMKVHLRLADSSSTGWAQPDKIAPIVNAIHLFGAPASDRRVSTTMRLTAALPVFKEYPGYRFHVAETLKEPVEEDLPEEKTSPSGAAALKPNLQRFGPATYRLSLSAKVFEASGGRGVAAEEDILVSNAPYLVGVNAPDSLEYVAKGAERSSKWLAVAPDLQARPVEDLHLVQLEYQFVSVLVKQNNDTYKYESRKKEIVRSDTTISLPKEGSDIKLPTDQPGDFAYELRDGHGSVLNRLSWTVAGAANLSRSLERNAELQIKLDKSSYSPGENIQISLRAPYTGHGLITIERDKVYAHAWFTADTTSSIQTITVPKELEGNGYVSVQFVRDLNSPEVFMSPLSYGTAPFKVAFDNHKMDLGLKNQALIEPGQTVRMELKTGQPARAVLFAVDEGILQVARYTSPDPLGYFFRKRMLDVDTLQILSLILPEFSRLLSASAPGGGDEEEASSRLNPFKRKHKEPVAYWSGIIDIPAEGYTFTYTAPDSFNGRLRIMAVAVAGDKMGVAEGNCEVRGPWVLTPNIPAFAAPGDELVLTTGVFNNLPGAEEATVQLQAGPGLSFISAQEQKLRIEPQREGTVEFRVKATESPGSTDLVFNVTSSGGAATTKESISIRPVSPFRTSLRTGILRDDKLALKPERTMYDEYRSESITLDPSPLAWVQGLANYLEKYPHGCTEQILSQAMPTLILTPSEELKRGTFKPLSRAFGILRERQNEKGGFSTWANNLTVDSELSVYAADFLREARERGLAVPGDLEQHSRAYLDLLAKDPAEGLVELRVKAHAIYLLTRMGIVTSSSIAATIEQLEAHHKKEWKKDLTAAYLASSYMLLKQDKKGKNLIADVSWASLPKPASKGSDATDQESVFSYYDDLAHDAELMTLLARHFPDRLAKLPENLLGEFAAHLSKDHFSSLSAALLIRALDQYGRSSEAAKNVLTATMEAADGSTAPLSFDGHPLVSSLTKGWKGLVLRKENGTLPAFYQLTEAGFDQNMPKTELKNGLEIVREYLSADKKPLEHVKVGEEFTVRLRIRTTNNQEISDIAIVDLLPAGTEPIIAEPKAPVVEESLESGEAGDEHADEESNGNSASQQQAAQNTAAEQKEAWQPEFVDTRDDRVIIYGTLSQDAVEYEYQVRAVNAGSVQSPPPYAEGMYDRSLQGRGKGGALKINAP